MENNERDKPKQDWVFIKAFQRGNALVKVNELQTHPRKRFSMEIGRANDDGKCIRHFGVFIDVENGKCRLRESIADKVTALVREAEEWALGMAQAQEDEIITARIDREERDANRGKTPTRHTGKTERDRAKRKGGNGENDKVEPTEDSKADTVIPDGEADPKPV